MQVSDPRCCGLDIHKRFVVACLLATTPDGTVPKVARPCGTRTDDLLALVDWLTAAGGTHVAMESTSASWRPLSNRLEGQFVVLVANASHIKTVPGRKTDVKDAEGIADLLRHGLLRGRCIPAPEQRHRRDRTRHRAHLVEARARITNRLPAVREDANGNLASVVSDVRGVSARAIREALLAGETDPTILAELARGRLRSKQDQRARAGVGRFSGHPAVMLAEHLSHLADLEAARERVSAEIERRLQEERAALDLLETVPGIGRRAAEILLAALGTDLSRFPPAKHLAAWAGLCPGHHESGGKRLSGTTPKGTKWLRQVLIEIAHVAAKTKDTDVAAHYRRIAARRGKKRALVALGHPILVIIYQILTKREPYRELGAAYFDRLERQRVEQRLVHRLERLGSTVSRQPVAPHPDLAA